MLQKSLTISTILTVFIAYIVIQNYQPSNKQSFANAIVQKKGKVLIVQLAKADTTPNQWEFPGGQVQAGEHLHDCLKRKLKADLGINAKVGKYLGTNTIYDKNKVSEIHLFNIDQFNDDIALEHESYKYAWVSPTELANYDMLNSCQPFIKLLQKNNQSKF